MQYRVHGPVVQTDEAVAILFCFPAVQKAQANFSPAPYHVANKSGGIQINFKIGWQRNGEFCDAGEIGNVRTVEWRQERVCREQIDRNSVPAQHLMQVQSVYGA